MTSLIDRWIEDAAIRGMSKNSIYSYRWVMLNFEKSQCPLVEADKMAIRAYVDKCRKAGLTTNTIGNRLNALRGFYDFLVFEGLRSDNPVYEVRKRYLNSYKTDSEIQTHQLISVEDAAEMVRKARISDIRDAAMLLVMFKTGVRRGELLSMEVQDIDWRNQSILLKPKKKRSNRLVFFDEETAFVLRRWLEVRAGRNLKGLSALWIASWGNKIDHGSLTYVIRKIALQCGLHDESSTHMESHFSAHCTRHWFSTYLSRNKMEERYIDWLRGDAPRGSIGAYIHIDPEDVRKSYLACIPQLGI